MNLLLIAQESLTRDSITIGGATVTSLAVVCSWTRNRSVFWAFIAGIFSFMYVIYWLLTRTKDEERYKKR